MTSEIRANTLKNRVGLGTVTYADTGIIVSGIVTCTELSGLTALNIAGVGTASTLDINGDIDVDGHTNLDNVSIAGVTTTTDHINIDADSKKLTIGDGQDLELYHDGSKSVIANKTGYLQINATETEVGLFVNPNADVRLAYDNDLKFQTTASGVRVFNGASGGGILEVYSGDGGSAAGPELKLIRNSGSPADADYIGQIKFVGESDTSVERNYAKITGKILDASNGTEDGILEFAHIKGGSQTITGRWRSDSLQLLNSTNLTVDGDLDIDGHTNLDNVSIAGVTTFSDDIKLPDDKTIRLGVKNATPNGELTIHHSSANVNYITSPTSRTLQILGNGGLLIRGSGNENIAYFLQSSVKLYQNQGLRLETTADGVDVTGDLSVSDSVGIGTATVASGKKLDVTDGIISVQGTGSHDSRIEFLRTNTNALGWIGIPNWSDTSLYIYGPTASGNEIAAAYGAGAWNFYTGGNSTARVVIDSSGRLLVGRTSSSHTSSKMEIQGGAEAYLRISPNTNTGVSGVVFGTADDHSTGGIYYQGSDDALVLAGHNNEERLRITSSGYVGINTASPAATFEIKDIGSSGPCVLIRGATSSEGDVTVPSGETFNFGHWDYSSSAFTERLRMSSGGKFTLGSSGDTNTGLLLLDKNLTAESDASDTANYHLVIASQSNSNTSKVGIAFKNTSDGTPVGAAILHHRTGGASVGDLAFYTSPSSGTTTERVRITSAGAISAGLSIGTAPWGASGNVNTGVRLVNNATSYAISANSKEIVAIFNRTNTGGAITEYKYNGNVVGSVITDGTNLELNSGATTKISAAGAERIRLDSDGLKFHGDTAAANALNDYEEGNYTPTLSFGGTTYTYGASNDYTLRSSHQTSDSNQIRYTKIGNRVFLNFAIFWNSTITARYVVTLPFAFSGSAYQMNVTPVTYRVVMGGDTLGTLGSGSAGFDTYRITGNTSNGGHGNVPLTQHSEVYYQISYETNA